MNEQQNTNVENNVEISTTQKQKSKKFKIDWKEVKGDLLATIILIVVGVIGVGLVIAGLAMIGDEWNSLIQLMILGKQAYILQAINDATMTQLVDLKIAEIGCGLLLIGTLMVIGSAVGIVWFWITDNHKN